MKKSNSYKMFEKFLKYLIEDPNREIVPEDWEKIYNFEILPGSVVVNKTRFVRVNIKNELFHIFNFTELRKLSLTYVNDFLIIESSGIKGFDFKYWFSKFPKLYRLRINQGSYETHKEIECYKIDLNDTSYYVIYYHAKDGFGIEIHDEDGLRKELFFGTLRNLSKNIYIDILYELIFNQKIILEELENLNVANYDYRSSQEQMKVLEDIDFIYQKS